MTTKSNRVTATTIIKALAGPTYVPGTPESTNPLFRGVAWCVNFMNEHKALYLACVMLWALSLVYCTYTAGYYDGKAEVYGEWAAEDHAAAQKQQAELATHHWYTPWRFVSFHK